MTDEKSAPQKPGYDPADMPDRITADNLHPEQDFGAPPGKEPR